MDNNTNIIELRGITKVYEDGYKAVDFWGLQAAARRRRSA